MAAVTKVERPVDGAAVVWRPMGARPARLAIVGGLPALAVWRSDLWATTAGWVILAVAGLYLLGGINVAGGGVAHGQHWCYDLLDGKGRRFWAGISVSPYGRLIGHRSAGRAREGTVMVPVRAFNTREESDDWETWRINALVAIRGWRMKNKAKRRPATRARRFALWVWWIPVFIVAGWLCPHLSMFGRDRQAMRAVRSPVL